MQFSEINAKGLSKYWVAASLDPQKLRIHISEVEPATRHFQQQFNASALHGHHCTVTQQESNPCRRQSKSA